MRRAGYVAREGAKALCRMPAKCVLYAFVICEIENQAAIWYVQVSFLWIKIREAHINQVWLIWSAKFVLDYGIILERD